MKTKLLFTIIFALVGLGAKAQPFSPALATMLQDTLTFIGSFPGTKGASMSVTCPGQGTWQGTVGLSHAGVPINSNMELALESNSKLFTSVILLKLQEDNLINLDNPVSLYLPSYPNVNPNITIRQLLNHTSGVADPFASQPFLDSLDAAPNRLWTPVEVLSWVGLPNFAPGTGFNYSNTNYILAGMVAQSVTGFHISRLIRDSILTPLNLDSTFFDVQETVLGFVAHQWKNSVDVTAISKVSFMSAVGSAGAMYSTSSEMAQWYSALMNGQIINAGSLAQMTNFTVLSGNYYGLGFKRQNINSTTLWGHDGRSDFSKSRIFYDPCMKILVCGLCNSNPGGIDGIAASLHGVAMRHLPGCTGAIIGAGTVCQGQNAVPYSVSAIARADSYIWTLPAGAIGNSNTNSITVDFGPAAASGNVTVKGINIYGESITTSFPVTVNTGCFPLPVSLINFDLQTLDKKTIRLYWSTATELNTDYFSVEKSTNAVSWRALSKVKATGYSTTIQNYSTIDFNPFYGITYYRLKQVDVDSKIYFSKILSNSITNNTGITVYPNPASNQINFTEIQNEIEIFNSTGQIVIPKKQHVKSVAIEHLPNGIYYIRTDKTNYRFILNH